MIQFATPEARRWLRAFFAPPRRRPLLPQRICRWLAESESNRTTDPLVASSGGQHLFVRRQKPDFKGAIILALEHVRAQQPNRGRKHGRLTRRESEVLYWLRDGKTDAEIAQILDVSARTVGKHLERVYPKLGVESRTAAAASPVIGATNPKRDHRT